MKGIMEGMESFDDRVYVRVSALFAGKGFSKKIRKKTDMHRKEGEYDNHEIYIQQDALFVFGHSFADRNDCLCQA